ncbi:hypothetical protein OKW24_004412 [Peribacillus simplex]|nr:hypothetical protein [Peribacillus simplex]
MQIEHDQEVQNLEKKLTEFMKNTYSQMNLYIKSS